MKIKKSKIKNLFMVLDRTKYEMPISSVFRHMATKNVTILLDKMKEIETAFAPPPEYQEYLNKRNMLITEINPSAATKSPVPNTKEQEEKIKEELTKLNSEYADLLQRVVALNVEKEKSMNEEIDLPLMQISIKDMPTIAKDTENHWVVWSVLETFVKDEQ